MRKLLVVAALALLPLASQAQVSLGLRLGYAPAGGDVANGVAMSDYTVKSQIPVQFDLAYRISPSISLGGYLSYGIAQADFPGCDVADCSGSVFRLGLQGFYTFSQVTGTFVPWLGLGFGWESASDTQELGGEKFESNYSGFEFLNLQAGGDFKVTEKLSVGPYAMVSFGSYTSYEEGDQSGDITNTGTHEWYGFGIRGKFDL